MIGSVWLDQVVATAKARHDMKVQLQKEQWKAKRERMLAAHHARIEQNAALNEGRNA